MNNNTFKKTALCAFIATLATGCGSSGGGDSESQGDANTFAVGSIAKIGEVDWYEYETTEANQTIALKVTSDTQRPDVDLLVGAYVMKDGKKELLYADHSAEGTVSSADIELNLVIDEPQTVYFSVRDLRDDEADENDTYRMTLNVAKTDGTSGFDDAIGLQVTEQPSCFKDTIGESGDLDTFKVEVTEAGVYHLVTTFDKKLDSSVSLLVGLYDEAGTLITGVSESEAVNSNRTYPMIVQLDPGTYYVLAKDSNNKYFDNYSTYEVCASKSGALEAGENDTKATAQSLALGDSVEGALEYDGDQDWYQIPITQATNGDVKVLNLNLDTTGADGAYRYEVSVRDAEDVVILTHTHYAGSDPYDVELKVDGEGPYYATITPTKGLIYNTTSDGDVLTGAPYVLTVNAIDVNDQYEVGEANDTQETAVLINAGVTINGKIAYRTDTDYYKLTVSGDEPKILEVFLETDNQESGGAVDYSVVILGSEVDRLLDDQLGSDGPTFLKTAMMTPQRNDASDHTYYIRVRDLADNESNANSGYSLRTEVKDINATLPDYDDITNAVYHSELDEQAELKSRTDSEVLKLLIKEPNSNIEDVEYYLNLPNMDREFADDQATLLFDGDNKHADFERTDNADGSVTFVTPWQGGYVDYQGDQDFFKLSIDALAPTAFQTDEFGENILVDGNPVTVEADTSWYYDIKVELKADASDVEYIWKLHYDLSTSNGRYISSNFNASAGDTSDTVEILDSVSGGEPSTFWMSEHYKGDYYFKISDYNLMTTPNNMFAEADWSVTKPYYFRISLTYHGGKSIYEAPAE